MIQRGECLVYTPTTAGAGGCSVSALGLSTLGGSRKDSCLSENTSFFKKSSNSDYGLRALHS